MPTDLVEMGCLLAWGYISGLIPELNLRAEPARLPTARKRSGELFPLPVLAPSLDELGDDGSTTEQRFELSVRCWVAIGCAATNVLYQCQQSGCGRKPGKVHVRALEDMSNKVRRFLCGVEVSEGSFATAVEELKTKRVSYSGEEISQPHPLSVRQIIKGLPPIGHGGSIPILPFLKGYTRYMVENPLEALLPESERGASPVSARVHIKREKRLKFSSF